MSKKKEKRTAYLNSELTVHEKGLVYILKFISFIIHGKLISDNSVCFNSMGGKKETCIHVSATTDDIPLNRMCLSTLSIVPQFTN